MQQRYNGADIATRLGAEVVRFEYRNGLPKKRQWAAPTISKSQPIGLMLIDADEEVPSSLWEEITKEIASGPCPGLLDLPKASRSWEG